MGPTPRGSHGEIPGLFSILPFSDNETHSNSPSSINHTVMPRPNENASALKDQMERIMKDTESRKESYAESQKTVSDLPPMPMRSRTNQEFTAWAEYMGGEKDVEFIEWKKTMVGENQKPSADADARPETSKATTKCENRPENKKK
ncbi:hypothetical protein A1O1_07084 [Capronia coronata CBS 617.96]|uniref:Uncharacterized protein n=1 Tax=Capronia coronata CBS 617.96 TaxID=1182541 RepID=W9Y2K9_9EURO|nr:uncharacterized protein A1O1_07084 [Capronia coronata CBS 617.96]EXJ83461.1 hypothetical protein A1O1_07084 [Capronia coronata CBS 617.96]